MRALVQRVAGAHVTVAATEVGRIGYGLVALVGVTHDDTLAEALRLADKVWRLRIFADDAGVMNRAAADVGGAILVVSQFTLYGDSRKGRRPSYRAAAPPEHAEPLVDAVAAHLRGFGAEVATGQFRAQMQVHLVNDGPVTLLVEVPPQER